MDKHIKEILKELYQDDPRIKQHSDELRTEVEELLASRPTGTVDKTFKESLRSQLLEKAATLSSKNISLHTITNNKKSMATNNIESWIHEMRTHGTSDADIRTRLKKSGWTDAQVDSVLPQASTPEKVPVHEVTRMITGQKNKKERKSKGERKSISPKRFKIYGTVAGTAFIILAMYTVGAIFGVPWDSSTQRGTNALKLGYVSNTSTYTGDTIIPATYSEQLAAQSTIGKFENYDQLTTFLDDHSANPSSGMYSDMVMKKSSVTGDFDDMSGETFGLGSANLEESRSLSIPSPASTSQSSSDYSRTNVQVEGVDEADIVKSDGKYIYTASGNNVFIVDAYPAETSEIITTITLDSRPQDIYVNGPTLVVFGREDNIYDKPFAESIRQFSSYTYFEVYDLTDITKPKQVRDLLFEGSYVNSRMIGNYVYFVTANSSLYFDDDMPVPLIIEDGELLPIDSDVARCNCPDVYYVDAYYPQYVFTSVAAIDIGDNEKAVTSDVYLLSSGENMYVSPENIYIVYTKYVSEFYLMIDAFKEVLADQLTKKDLQRIEAIESAPVYMLSQDEKTMKVYTILLKYIGYDMYGIAGNEDEAEAIMEKVEAKVKEMYVDISKELEKTVIHKISIDQDTLEYAGSGEVTGHVLNQFAMDEFDGYFRIATTKGRTWSTFGIDIDSDDSESYSNVYVLDKDLDVVGSVEELAKGEEIYSARFMQGRVYLVTFRQVDPLFAIDLTNPKNPVVLGELKIPGFSSYLHPYDDNLLIGFGKEGTESGRIEGLKLSLFDVSDVSNLKEVDTYVMGDSGSDSIALNDHKAFLFSKSKNLLVVPVTLREEKTAGSYSYDYTHGAMVFTITPDGFEFEKRIDHSDGSSADTDSRYYYGNSYYGTSVKRSMYINDTLYTLSDSYLKAHTLGTLNEARSITFPTETTDNDVYYLE